MSNHTAPTVTPGMVYHNAADAIDWLCRAFGFERKLVVPGEAPGTIMHAHLTFGSGGIMLGSAETNSRPELQQSPRELGNLCSHSISVYVTDIDTHYARAKAEGAKIVMELEEKPYGGKGYACRDIEGYVWHFGSYDPWADTEAG